MEHEELASGTDDIVKLNGDLCAPITAELYAMEHLKANSYIILNLLIHHIENPSIMLPVYMLVKYLYFELFVGS